MWRTGLRRTICSLFVCLIVHSGVVYCNAQDGDEPTVPLSDEELAAKPVSELLGIFQAELLRVSGQKEVMRNDRTLQEIIQRGGRSEAKQLRKLLYLRERTLASLNDRYAELRQMQALVKERNGMNARLNIVKDEYVQIALVKTRLRDNSALFTAVRRMENRPDPLLVELLDGEKVVTSPRKPLLLNVAVSNVDVNGQPLFVNETRKDIHGRNPHWRIVMSDEGGKQVKAIQLGQADQNKLTVLRGQRLEPSDSWNDQISLQDYVVLPEPGRYQTTLYYHNYLGIADLPSHDSLAGLITFQSKPFEIEVKPLIREVIQLTEAEYAESKQWVRELDTARRIRYFLVEYAPKYEFFVKPDSVEGKLLRLGRKALPALLERLEDETMTPQAQAWILAMLYSITREYETEPFVRGQTMSIHRNIEFAKQVKSGVEMDTALHGRIRDRWRYLHKRCFEFQITEVE